VRCFGVAQHQKGVADAMIEARACMNDLVVAQEASDVESSLRLDFLLLHNL